MRQKELSISQTGAVLVAGIVAVVLASLGARYWALAAQSIVSGSTLLFMSFYWSGYRPKAPRPSVDAMALLRFGGYVGACNIVTFFQVNLDSVLIGRYCGVGELGFYSRALLLRTLPALYAATALTDVMIPALVAIRGDPARMGIAFIRTVRIIAFVGCPIAAALGVTAVESVRLIYGPRWASVGPLLIWLSFPAFVLPLTQAMGWLFIASGKVRRMFFLSACTLPVVALSYFCAVRWGSIGIAIASAALFTIPMPWLTGFLAHSAAGLSFRRTFSALMPIIFSSIGAAGLALVVGYWATVLEFHWIAILCFKVSMGLLFYLLLTFFLVRPLPIGRLENVADQVRRVLNRGGGLVISTH